MTCLNQNIKGVCYCSRCLRQDQITKLKALNYSLGGLKKENFVGKEEEPNGPLEEFALESIRQTVKILAPQPQQQKTGDDDKKFMKTMEFLGYSVDGKDGEEAEGEDNSESEKNTA